MAELRFKIKDSEGICHMSVDSESHAYRLLSNFVKHNKKLIERATYFSNKGAIIELSIDRINDLVDSILFDTEPYIPIIFRPKEIVKEPMFDTWSTKYGYED